MSIRVLASAMAAAFMLVPWAPLAAAHCPTGDAGVPVPALSGTPLAVSTCPLNDPVEAQLQALSAASGGTVAFVLVKDFSFHPDVVTVKSGGTVVFVYADVDWNQQHDPTSSGPCLDAQVDPVAEPAACVPTDSARCFSYEADHGLNAMKALGDNYPLTFRYAPASGIAKSMGVLSGTPVLGEPPLAQAFKACAPDTGYDTPSQAVIPYHCALHAGPFGPHPEMRGAIIVTA